MDTSFLNFTYDIYTYDVPPPSNDAGIRMSSTDILFTVLNILTFLMGMSLNITVIVGICKKSYEKSAWDVIFVWNCIQNMLVIILSDIMFSVGFSHWYLPHWMCPVIQFLHQFAIGSTSITVSCLVFISAVFYKDLSKRCLPAEIFLIVFSGSVAAIISIPSAIYSKTETIGLSHSATVCFANYIQAYEWAIFVLFFFCPVLATIGLTTLMALLSRACTNKRVLIIRVLIAVIYIVCWSPHWILYFVSSVDPLLYSSYAIGVLWRVFLWLIPLGCCLPALAVLILDPSVRQTLFCKGDSRDTDGTRMELTKN